MGRPMITKTIITTMMTTMLNVNGLYNTNENKFTN